MGKALGWCVVAQIFLTLVCMGLRFLWVRYSNEDHLKFLHKYVGIEDESPKTPFFDMTFRWIQFVLSITTVLLWVYKTYTWRVGTAENILELMMCPPSSSPFPAPSPPPSPRQTLCCHGPPLRACTRMACSSIFDPPVFSNRWLQSGGTT